ncbi:MAG: cytochrome c [bacterium]
MRAKLFPALGLMILIASLSLFLMDYSYSQRMGMGGGMMGRGMMGGGRNLGKNPVKPTAISIDNGKALFKSHCAVCHGPRGRGDGPAATGLNPRPADLMRSARRLRDGVVAGVISDGRRAMPSFRTILTPSQIWHLTNFVKSLGR